ncbi:hypothetical protein FQR65_LT06420 [Abscondita terminalis]|nr:hypothetical protein FQR65_LT06420 [Abscondita terminalis]
MPKIKQKVVGEDEAKPVVVRLSDLGIFESTPEQVDLQIQIERVWYILDNTIDKLKVAACLPAFLKNNACWLRMHCVQSDIDYIQTTCMRYSSKDELIDKEEHYNVETVIDTIAPPSSNLLKSLDTMVDPHIAHVLELLWNNNDLKQKALQDFDKMVDSNVKTFISCFNNLRKIARTRLPQTAAEQKMREKNLRKTWQENQSKKDEIKALKEAIEIQRRTFQEQIDEKKRISEELQNKYDTIMKEFNTHINQLSKSCETEMARNSVKNHVVLEGLRQEIKSVSHQHDMLVLQHLQDERKLRAKRLKVETQLVNWLNKYDEDMSERQRQYDELEETFEKEKIELEKIEELFALQEEDYFIVMEEKMGRQLREQQRKIENFRVNHAARVIQRYWRLYMSSQLEKMDKKKGKGKEKGKGKGKGRKKKTEKQKNKKKLKSK